jgi:hypothetical protein
MIQRIVIVAALSILWVLLWGLDIAHPWVIQPLPLHIARAVCALVLLLAGITVVLRRPSKAAWGFFAFSLFGVGAPAPAYAFALPAAASAGALVFALYLMCEEVAVWRRTVEIVAYGLAATGVAVGAWSTLSAFSGGFWLQWFVSISWIVQACAAVVAPLVLLETCVRSNGETRERLRWVLAGFILNACVVPFILAADQGTLVVLPQWLIVVLSAADAIVIASTVPYALLKQPIRDVNVALSWVLTYAIFAAIAVGAVVASHVFVQMRDGAFALLGALGFLFGMVHTRVERWIERRLLRPRHRALEHLKMVIDAMPLVASRDKVDRLVIEEPVHSLALEGGTLLWCRADGTLSTRHEFGSAPPALTHQSHESALPACLQNKKETLRLNQHGWNSSALAVPLCSNGVLVAVALYALHENGTDIDRGEIAIVDALAAAAGEAYGRIEAIGLREEMRDLREEIDESDVAPNVRRLR